MTRAAPVSQTDIKRAVKAALDAGLDVTSVKVNWATGEIDMTTERARAGTSELQRGYAKRDISI